LKSENNYTGQKAFDYRPEKLDLKINELLMFGTPIQQETECFVLNNFFEKVYNIYSDEDVVQDMDIFSTKKESVQRLRIIENIDNQKDIPQIIQLKIMIDREMKKIINNDESKIISLVTTNTQQQEECESFWQKLFSKNRFSSKKTKDPSHKEMWFVSWDKLKENVTSPLEFIPSVIFTPLLQNAIESVEENTTDIDVNIRLTKNNLKIYIFNHNEEEKLIQNKISMQRDVIDAIKSKIIEKKFKLIVRKKW
jgi:hypothetical protein